MGKSQVTCNQVENFISVPAKKFSILISFFLWFMRVSRSIDLESSTLNTHLFDSLRCKRIPKTVKRLEEKQRENKIIFRKQARTVCVLNCSKKKVICRYSTLLSGNQEVIPYTPLTAMVKIARGLNTFIHHQTEGVKPIWSLSTPQSPWDLGSRYASRLHQVSFVADRPHSPDCFEKGA